MVGEHARREWDQLVGDGRPEHAGCHRVDVPDAAWGEHVFDPFKYRLPIPSS